MKPDARDRKATIEENAVASEELATYPQALVGYRVWQLKEGKLYPLHTKASAWVPGINTAECTKSDHQAPAAGCKCGFNAHHQLKGALEEAEYWRYHYKRSDKIQILVIGAIAGKGHVELHRSGFRCQEAQILGLLPIEMTDLDRHICVGSSYKAVAAAAEHYHVPLYDHRKQLRETVVALKKKHGLTTASEKLLPEPAGMLRTRSSGEKLLCVSILKVSIWLGIITGIICLAGVVFASPELQAIGKIIFEVALFSGILGFMVFIAQIHKVL